MFHMYGRTLSQYFAAELLKVLPACLIAEESFLVFFEEGRGRLP